MEVVFLSNGQACYLKEKIGNKFIVNKIFEFEDYENGWQEIPDTNDIVVDVIFNKPPIEKINTQLKELEIQKKQILSEISELKREKTSIKRELEEITKTQITNNKFILNRSDLINAKTLALFIKDRPMPMVMTDNDKSFRGLKISLIVEIKTGEERSWGYILYTDYGISSSHYLCEKYGFLVNPTQEEIDDVIIKRFTEFTFPDYLLKDVPDKYLTPELLKQKNERLSIERENEKIKLNKQLQETKERLLKLDMVSK